MEANNLRGFDKIGEIYNRELNRFLRKVREGEQTWVYLQVALTLFTIAFFVVAAIRPAATTIAGLVGEVKKKEALTRQMMIKINSLVEAQSNYALLQSEAETVNSVLPLAFDVARANAQFYGIAMRNSINLDSLTAPDLKFFALSREGERGDVEGMDFNMSVSGDYPYLLSFLSDIGKNRRMTEIETINISSPKKQLDDQLEKLKIGIKISLSGKIFYWR